jgi:hypothetical protein
MAYAYQVALPLVPAVLGTRITRFKLEAGVLECCCHPIAKSAERWAGAKVGCDSANVRNSDARRFQLVHSRVTYPVGLSAHAVGLSSTTRCYPVG